MENSEKLKNLQRAQALSDQLRMLEDRLQLLEKRRQEIEYAKLELKKMKEKGEVEAYRFLGANVLVKKNADEILSDLEEENKLIENQVNLIKQQITQGRKALESMLKALGYTSKTSE